jgi:predicted  nucleic acid-binding Zn-ribbon protein
MLEKVLNKIGIYTAKQYLALQADLNAFKERNGYLRLALDAKEDEIKRLAGALQASEEAKANALTELKKIREKYIRRVKGRKI